MGSNRRNEDGQETSIVRELVITLIQVVVVLVFCFLIIKYVGQRSIVSGSSMEPTLSDGDNILVDKISYRFKDPERFDIVPFVYTHKKDTWFIKRIIGLPGETVYIDSEGNIYINGEVLEENYGLETIDYAGLAATPITLGEDEYFVLGDNRRNREDSRYADVANITRDQIVGKSLLRFYPFNKFGLIKHK